MGEDDRKDREGPQYGTWISREEQQDMQVERQPQQNSGDRSEASRQQGWSQEGSGEQQQGSLFQERDGYEQAEERPGREMQERQHLVDENLFERRQQDDADPTEDLSKDPEDDHRSIREQQDRVRQQGARTPEERLGSGWADPEDPTQMIEEDTINEDEENLADKRI